VPDLTRDVRTRRPSAIALLGVIAGVTAPVPLVLAFVGWERGADVSFVFFAMLTGSIVSAILVAAWWRAVRVKRRVTVVRLIGLVLLGLAILLSLVVLLGAVGVAIDAIVPF
jgi:hypothetical protein